MSLQVVQAQSLCVCVCMCPCMCVSCVCAQACTSILCENSVRNKNQYHCKWYKPSLCVCVFVCVCVCVCVCVSMYVCVMCVCTGMYQGRRRRSGCTVLTGPLFITEAFFNYIIVYSCTTSLRVRSQSVMR